MHVSAAARAQRAAVDPKVEPRRPHRVPQARLLPVISMHCSTRSDAACSVMSRALYCVRRAAGLPFFRI